MKYLKLDAQYSECHGLSKALVGSPCFVPNSFNGFEFELIGTSSHPIRFISDRNGVPIASNVVLIPLDTIKLCPYIAMKEKLSITYLDPYYDYKVRSCGELEYCIKGVIGCSYGGHGRRGDLEEFRDIQIDYNKLPKGAEIVEM